MIKYRGKIPERNYSLRDFYENGVVLHWAVRFYDYDKKVPMIRAIFRSNGLLGEIRTTCYGDAYAVDVVWGMSTNERACLTTECSSIRQAKSILFEWFKSKGFKIPKKITDNDLSKNYLSFDNIQLDMFPIKL